MNALERTRSAIRGQNVDRLPCFPILIAPACELTGVKQGDYSQDADLMADTLIRARELIGTDGIYVSRDNWICYEALGGDMTFPEDDEPNGKEVLLKSVGDFRKLSVPDPESAPGMSTVLAAAREVVKAVGNDFYIQANIDCGPFTMAGILRGTQDFLLDIVTHDENEVHSFLEFCTEVVIAYGRAMIASGVHGIQYGDSTASLISPDLYEKFVLPYQKRSLCALANPCTDLWVHICGDTRHILHLLRDLDFQGFEVDARVNLREANKLLGRKTLKGNLDTTFLLRESEEAVYIATIKMLKECNLRTGLVVSPGCGVPRMTPPGNLRAMMRACEDYRPAETTSYFSEL
jgi:uroporphyrinogen decarboxylase